ncbi:MAG: DUF2207 domain-containing protein [Bacilli bacterium]|nr:DUF2207 domain-containing protein [Bacilli bacterium]MDD4406844.1 DUF2207 domain-containing protein [Bacilli bacterium]
MKKILLFLLLLIPTVVNADVKVLTHLIDAEIEIAGALKVKETIIIEGDNKLFSRNLNYKMIDEVWNKKDLNFESSPIYNGYSLENIKVSAFKTNGEIDFNHEVKSFFNELDPTKRSENYFTRVNNKLGANININYDTSKNDKTAYYIEYLVTNVIVSHNDVNELNFTFKNLNYNADNTLIRVIIPYPTNSDLFRVWLHGPSNGELNYLVTENKEKIGIISFFPNINSSVNIRLTIPKEQVGIDIYLNKTKADALNKIKQIENAKLDQQDFNSKSLIIIKYVVIVLSIIYVISSLILFKYNFKSLNILYLVLGIIIAIFNFIFKIHIIYIYFIIFVPLIILLIKKLNKK